MTDFINQLLNEADQGNVISFTREYLDFINKNIIFFLKILIKDKNHKSLNEVKNQLNPLYCSYKNYLEEVFQKTGYGFVKRLGDPHNNGKSTVVVENISNKTIYKPVSL